MKITLFISAILSAGFVPAALHASSGSTAASAINALGVDLLEKSGKAGSNVLLSPYSIQSALAMTYAGADGGTRDEMARVLHFPKAGTELNASFAALSRELDEIGRNTTKIVADSKKYGGPGVPVTLRVANRLFGQQGFDFRKPFLEIVKKDYGAPLEQLDFASAPDSATRTINGWVEAQTQRRIRGLIPDNALDKSTRLVLVNAIYFKAAWADEFNEYATEPRAFRIDGAKKTDVPTMFRKSQTGYAKRDGYAAISLPYIGDSLQFLILLPDHADGLAALERKLDAKMLSSCANLDTMEIDLYLPKFKLAPPTLALGDELQALGMKTAFDVPKGSANFDLMAPRTPDRYLYISQVFHKTFLALDEHGTEAAAATAVAMAPGAAPGVERKPVEVHVDHPFLFAIQHSASGACLFLGRVTDPR